MGGSFHADDGGPVLPLPDPVLKRVADGGALQMGIRPEDVVVIPQAGEGGWAVTVSTVEHLGPETLVGFVFGEDWRRGYGQEARDSFARVSGYSSLVRGSPLSIRFNSEKLAFFSVEDGLSLNPRR